MYKKNSIYSINKKYSDAIVYPFANGEEVRITREDFPIEEEFLAFKAWSDENYRKTDNYEDNTAKKTVSIDDVSESALAVPGIDVVIKRQHQRAEERRKASDIVVQLKDKLTETQFRRLCLYHIEGLDTYEIGRLEDASHQAVCKSLALAEEKIKKIFPETAKKGC